MNIYLVLLEALCTFAILSYLYKENFVFRFFENVFLGISVGYIVVMSFGTIQNSAIQPLMKGNFIYVIPILLGFFLFFSLSRKYYFIYRLPMALLVGAGLGLGIRGNVHTTILGQLISNIQLISPLKDSTSNINGLIIIIGTVLALYYFTFTYFPERKGVSGSMMKVARLFLMVFFGTTFANGVLLRTAYFAGRMMFLWTPEAWFTVGIAAVLFTIGILYDTRLRKQV